METLELTKANAVKAYNSANKEGRDLLINMFGQDTFIKRDIKERVKTFKDACHIQGIDPKSVFNNQESLDVIAYKKLKVIRNALNEGWMPNWDNLDQVKYVPYFDMRSRAAGFGFSRSGCDGWSSDTGVGSRLCYHSKEIAEYVGTQFLDIYKDFITE